MSACRATREAVNKAVEDLLADGQTISIRRVQNVIGHGSHEAIAAHLRAIDPTGATARSRPALLLACLRSRTAAWEQSVEDLGRERDLVAQWDAWWHGLPYEQRRRLPKPPKRTSRRRATRQVRPTDQPGHQEVEVPIVIASDRPRRQTHFTQADADRLPDLGRCEA